MALLPPSWQHNICACAHISRQWRYTNVNVYWVFLFAVLIYLHGFIIGSLLPLHLETWHCAQWNRWWRNQENGRRVPVADADVIGRQELKWREIKRLRKTKSEMAIQMATVSQVNFSAFWRWLNTFSMSMCSHNWFYSSLMDKCRFTDPRSSNFVDWSTVASYMIWDRLLYTRTIVLSQYNNCITIAIFSYLMNNTLILIRYCPTLRCKCSYR